MNSQAEELPTTSQSSQTTEQQGTLTSLWATLLASLLGVVAGLTAWCIIISLSQIDLWMVAILPGALTGYVIGLITRRSISNLVDARTFRQTFSEITLLGLVIILQTILAIALASHRDFDQQMKRIRSATQSDDAVLKNMIARVNQDSKATTPVTPKTPDKLADPKNQQAEKKSNESSPKAQNENTPPTLDPPNDQQTKRLVNNEQPTSYASMLADLTMKRLARHPGEWISAGLISIAGCLWAFFATSTGQSSKR